MTLDFNKHPCFNADVRHDCGRVHLPVAPKCNIQCNYCNRLYDSVSENYPGVAHAILTPDQAMSYLGKVIARDPRISVVGIVGPGDPFANPQETMKTLRMVRDKYPEMLLCVSSNGLNIVPYIDELVELEIGHVTITMNTLEGGTGEKIYAWVRDGVRILRGRAGAERLIKKQLEAIRLLKDRGITVKVNIIIIPGVNEDHIVDVARAVSELGADILNCIPMCPVEGTPLAENGEPTAELVATVRDLASRYISQMRHCVRCRADAVGLLGEEMTEANLQDLRESAAEAPVMDKTRPCVAVVSSEGLLVNRHLGQADSLMIFTESTDGESFIHLDTRTAPPPGYGDQRWNDMANLLTDCRAVLTSAAGDKPKKVLADNGIRVIEMEGLIESALNDVFSDITLRCPSRWAACSSGCAGKDMSCG